MTEPISIGEAIVYWNEIVGPGDKVDILPVDLREKDEDGGNYRARKNFGSLRSLLGPGPFIIQSMRQWPCGRVVLYIKGKKNEEIGVYAQEFKKFS